jgi:hypothetical protein
MGRHSRLDSLDTTPSNVLDLTAYRLQRTVQLLGVEAADAFMFDWPASAPELDTSADIIDITQRIYKRDHQPYFSNPRLQGIIDRFGIDPATSDLDRWKRPETD